jgi:HPr kinase/phosphorylase
MSTSAPHIQHASCVALHGKAVLIMGASGSGKSSLALQLMAFGCALVADDCTEIEPGSDGLIARCPAAIAGLIEARCVGLLKADATPSARLALVVDLDQAETDRLPPHRSITLCGQALPLLHNSASSHFPAAILQYLRAGRRD